MFELWQDYVFGIGGLILAMLLIPTLLDKSSSVSRKTSIPTFIFLYIFSFSFYTLEFYIATISHFISASIWVAIALWRPIPREKLMGYSLTFKD